MVEIVGMGCRFPGGINSVNQYWEFLKGRRSAIREIPPDRWNTKDFSGAVAQGHSRTTRAGWLDQVDHFDTGYFQLSQREAAEMDPQQRMVLEVAHEALFDANINPLELSGKRVGVYAGAGLAEYQGITFSDPDNITSHTMLGNSLAVIANRLSYFLNLEGPSLTVDTACSSALTALYLACQALSTGDCELALVAGVNALLGPSPFIGFSQAHMLSPRGMLSPFDADADGYVRGEGCGVVVLGRSDQPFQKLRRVYAEIIACQVNEDGKTPSLPIPSQIRQISLMQHALKCAAVQPEQVVYVEAHGTGTPVGDPIEAGAIAAAMVGKRRSSLAIGSAKGHVGHLETASGIVGLTKAALCLYHGKLVPTLGHNEWSPGIDAKGLRLRIPTQVESLPESETGGDPLIGVCSYGFGGANAFALLRPTNTNSVEEEVHGGPLLLPLSAHRPEALMELDARYSTLPREELYQAAEWAGIALPAMRYRRVRVAPDGDVFGSNAMLIEGEAKGDPPRLIFAYGGQGTQHPAMGRLLYETFPSFRRSVDMANDIYGRISGCSLIAQYGFCQRDMDLSALSDVLVALPSIIMVQVGLTTLLEESGVRPAAVLGHSTGEMTGAWTCGAINLETLMHLTFERAFAQSQMRQGAMAAWAAEEEQTQEILQKLNVADHVVIAARNGAEALTLAGDPESIDALVAYGKEIGLRTTKLTVPRAYHSPHVDPVLPILRDRIGSIAGRASAVPFVSTVAGSTGLIRGEDLNGDYWLRNIRNAVDFHTGMQEAARRGQVFLEISPKPALSGYLAARHDRAVLSALDRNIPEDIALRQCLGGLFVKGLDIKWGTVQAPKRFIPIPHVAWHHSAPLRSATWKMPNAAPSMGRMTDDHIELKEELYGFLSDHKVDGEIVMPGAGFVALALARTPKPMRAVEFRRFLSLWRDDGKTTLKWVQGDGSLELTADDTSHMYCRFAETEGLMPDLATLESARQRCNTVVETSRLYEVLRRHGGFDFGPAFRNIAEFRAGDAEAVVRIQVSQTIPEGWARKAVLLDGCFQALIVLRGLDTHCFVPIKIETLWWNPRCESVTDLWCHVRLTEIGRGSAKGSITLWDSTVGNIGHIEGLEIKRITSSHAAKPNLYTLVYETPGISENIRHWDWSDPGACLVRLFGDEPAKRTLRILDLSVGQVALSALSKLPTDLTAAVMPYVVTGGSLPTNSPEWCHLFDPLDPPELRSFDIVIGRNGSPWLALGGILSEWEDVVALPSMNEISEDQPSPVCLFGADLEKAWPMDVPTSALAQAKLVIDAGDSLEQASLLLRQLVELKDAPATIFFIREDISAPPSALWGFARAARKEQPQLRIYTVGMPAAVSMTAAVSHLLTLSKSGLGGDNELRWNGSGWHVPRLIALNTLPAPELTGGARIEIGQPGDLTSLRWRNINTACEDLDGDEIRIHIQFAALNFKDVMLALGMLPGYTPALGFEASGTIVESGADVARLYPEFQAGRTVLVIAHNEPASIIGTTAVVKARNCVLKPDNVNAVEGAGFLSAYMAAWYALKHAARVDRGETVLIHSAAGGVGMAAVQAARALGAEIIASAGSETKRMYLRESLGLEKIFDSRRPAEFYKTIEVLTQGRGVDVVLNSLSGDGLRESLRCLAPGGRHIEIGKRDILHQEMTLGLGALKNNISFHSVHLDGMAVTHPPRLRALMEECADRLARGEASPLPVTVFPAERAVDAFRLMSAANHIGKLVISPPDGDRNVPQGHAVVTELIPWSLFPKAETQLITGGTGGIGLELARFMARRGAGRILLASRRAQLSARASIILESIRRDHPRCRIDVISLDLSDPQQLDSLFAKEPGITGVFHLASAFHAERATEIESKSLETWSTKAEAAWQIHRLTEKRFLRHFVLFSSVAAFYGLSQQATYIAANAALQELARSRRFLGLPALTIDLPVLLGAGRVSEVGHVLELQLTTDKGYTAISFSDIEVWLERLLANPQSCPPVVTLDAPRWHDQWVSKSQRTVFAHLIPRNKFQAEDAGQGAPDFRDASEVDVEIRRKISSLLGARPDEIELTIPLSHLGLDSLAAIELQSWARQKYRVEISQTRLLTGASASTLIEAITGHSTNGSGIANSSTIIPAKESTLPEIQPITAVDSTGNGTSAVPTIDVGVPTKPNVSVYSTQIQPAPKGERIVHPAPTLSISFLEQLRETLRDNNQVIVFRAAQSEHFCLGMDLTQTSFGDAQMSQGLELFADVMKQLEAAKMPIICVVEGKCRGGGMLFPGIATIVLASEDATFGFPEIRNGGLPGVVSVAVQRRISQAHCRRYMLTGDIFDAKMAQQIGLVDFVGNGDAVEQELSRLLARFASIDPSLLQTCHSDCPAKNTDLALITMGRIGNPVRADNQNLQKPPVVRLIHEAVDGLAVIEFNNPSTGNAIDRQMAQDLRHAVEAGRRLDDLRAVILQGEGEHFCVGANRQYVMSTKEFPLLTAAQVTYDIYRAFVDIRQLPVPVISVVHGKVLGGGVAAMLNADYRICTADATFSYGNISRGVCPGMLLSESLEHLVGQKWAMELYLNNYTLTAAEALTIGLVNEILPTREEALQHARAMARRIDSYPAMGVRTTLALMRPQIDLSRLARESLGMARCIFEGGGFTGRNEETRLLPPGKLLRSHFPLKSEVAKPARASDVGIIAMELYFPDHMVLQSDMERHHNCAGKYTVGLGQEAITFCGNDEDPVSMALTAVQRLMERYGVDWKQIGRLEVGTESAFDRSKSIKTYLMQLFEDHGCNNIEGVDTYNACYGGTSALFNTIAWCQSEAWDGRLGLVVCVDIADLDEEHCHLSGAAAVAMLIGPDAALVMKPERASHMLHSWDFYKPVGWQDPFPVMRDGKHSIEVYMSCLDGCHKALSQKTGVTSLLQQHDYFVFHCSTTYLVKRAFDRLLQNDAPTLSLPEKQSLYEAMVRPSTILTTQLGSTYTASVYVSLYSLLWQKYEEVVGKTIGIYSYGSGAGSSFYSLRVVRPPQIDRSIAQKLEVRRRYEPSDFVKLMQKYSSGYGRFNYVPDDHQNKTNGVYYLRRVDEWGCRTYSRYV